MLHFLMLAQLPIITSLLQKKRELAKELVVQASREAAEAAEVVGSADVDRAVLVCIKKEEDDSM